MKRLVLFAALCVVSSTSFAVVYRWTDAQGKVQYGDRPPDGVQAELVSLLTAHSNSTPARSTGVSASKLTATTTPTAAAKPSDDAAKKAVAEDVAAAKQKQCTEAKERYRVLIEGRRLYRNGKDGEREYLTSEQIDSERLNAKRDLDVACNGAD